MNTYQIYECQGVACRSHRECNVHGRFPPIGQDATTPQGAAELAIRAAHEEPVSDWYGIFDAKDRPVLHVVAPDGSESTWQVTSRIECAAVEVK